MRQRGVAARTRTLHRHRGDRGSSAVELAVVAPALLLLIFLSLQAGLYYYGRVVAEQAAREGVSVLRLAQDEATFLAIRDQVQERVESYAANVGREALVGPVADPGYDADAGKVTVGVTGRVISLVPGIDLNVTAEVSGEIERFEGDESPLP